MAFISKVFQYSAYFITYVVEIMYLSPVGCLLLLHGWKTKCRQK